MKRIAITGGIGSGKSYVCRKLQQSGIEVYDCDSAAKRLMNESQELKAQLMELVGNEVYAEGKLNKPVMATFLLASEANKQAINKIVHPAVIADFYASGKQWMECAILFEAHLENTVDIIIAVTASDETRIQRIMQRDNLSREKAQAWLNAQFPQSEITKRSHFTISNNGDEDIDSQIKQLMQVITAK